MEGYRTALLTQSQEGLIMLIAAIGLAEMGCVASGCSQLWFTNLLQRQGMALQGTIVDRIPRGGQGTGNCDGGCLVFSCDSSFLLAFFSTFVLAGFRRSNPPQREEAQTMAVLVMMIMLV